MRVTGVFKARRVPSQEADIIIHLSLASMTRLLAGLLAMSGQGHDCGGGEQAA